MLQRLLGFRRFLRHAYAIDLDGTRLDDPTSDPDRLCAFARPVAHDGGGRLSRWQVEEPSISVLSGTAPGSVT